MLLRITQLMLFWQASHQHLKHLSRMPVLFNLVKSKIFSVVQEYEMKIILDEEQKNKSHTMPYFTVSSPTYQNTFQMQLKTTIIPSTILPMYKCQIIQYHQIHRIVYLRHHPLQI